MQRGYDIGFIESQIKYWSLMKRKYAQLEKNRTAEFNTKELLSMINSITLDNSIRRYLAKSTKTVPIIENYYNSKALYLIIEDIYVINVSRELYGLSLVISKVYKNINMLSSDLTITNLKQRPHRRIRTIEEYTGTRYFNLIKSIFEIPFDNSIRNRAVSFTLPCQFNAQREANRRGYGNRYEGNWQTHEGTNYGETTTFAIIGVIVK